MKFSYLLFALLFLAIDGCSDFTSEANEFELSGKMYACDENVQGDIANDTKLGKKLYCNGLHWIDLVPEDSIVQNISNTQIMYECKNGAVVKFKNLCSEQPNDYLPLDDSEYPYAGIPRIVIETENHRAIKDRETEIPAKLQIWGESAPESEIMELTIRGRGNTSWTDMPKKSYKIEFLKKQEMLGMPKDKDWALIANYADKTLMRNYLVYHLASRLGSYYSPRCKFVELFVNQEFLGLYLFTETIKKGVHRVNAHSDFSYIVEFDRKHREYEQFDSIASPLINKSRIYRVHSPKNASKNMLDTLKEYMKDFEQFLSTIKDGGSGNVSNWIDEKESITYYWIQEFTKNPDTGLYGNFFTSVYFSWEKGGGIKMGPVWDYDLAFGNHYRDSINNYANWYIRNDWYKYLLQDSSYEANAIRYWHMHEPIFKSVLDSINSCQMKINLAAKNNFKRWDILNVKEKNIWLNKSYKSYEESVNDLKSWIYQRIEWMNSQLED